MSIKTIASSAIVFLAASAFVGVGVGPAAAAKRDQHAASATHRVHRVRAADRWHQRPHLVARRNAMPVYGQRGLTEYDYNHPRETPGVVFVPGRGILGESCDLPTSTCSNEYRDVQ
jgi:hypothetical protein